VFAALAESSLLGQDGLLQYGGGVGHYPFGQVSVIDGPGGGMGWLVWRRADHRNGS
jgi:hypothetical protein